jgi:formamidopyrimidine-DNA glycosylase
MPELPEVETMKRGLAAVEGATVTQAMRTPCKCRPIEIRPRIDFLNRRIAGCRISAVERLGKRIVLQMDTGDRLIFEPRMTGIVLTGEPPDREHLRFELRLARSKAEGVKFWDRRGLGKIALLDPAAFQSRVDAGYLGPDACQIGVDELRQRGKGSRREIKVALLDQKLVAGIGNLYASEILHVAGVDPRARCCRLTVNQWSRIHAAMHCVLQSAIEHEGSTLSDGTYQKALNDPGGYQNHHRVYDRAGDQCPSCRRQPIVRIVQAQRSTFFCQHCQKKR